MDQNTQQPNEVQHVEALAVASDVIGQMERASIDIQVSTAHAYPRSLKTFIEKATAMVKVDQETAESCIYRRPVGKDANGDATYAEGESIRLAEIVGATYGNLRVGAIISEMNPRYVKAQGFAHDLESNFASKSEVVESTVKRNGQPYDERMRVVVAKAAMSKAMRDAIFRVVPKSLCKPLVKEAYLVISGSQKPLAERRAAVDSWLKKLPIDSARVFAALKVAGTAEMTDAHLIDLTGIRTAMKDGEITLEEAFPELPKEDKPGVDDKSLKGKLKGKGVAGAPMSPKVDPEGNQTPPAGQ
jgi:hypothetical protein